jgi:H+-transporting ATPase
MLLTSLNDLPIVAIAYDRTKIDDYPVSWDRGEVLTFSILLGILGVISSFRIFYVAEKIPVSVGAIRTFVFLNLVADTL